MAEYPDGHRYPSMDSGDIAAHREWTARQRRGMVAPEQAEYASSYPVDGSEYVPIFDREGKPKSVAQWRAEVAEAERRAASPAKPLDILAVGDGAFGLTTGFAQVLRKLLAEFARRGHRVAQVASLDAAPTCDSRPYYAAGVRPFFPDSSSPLGLEVFPRAVKEFGVPDVIFFQGDPATGYYWLDVWRQFAPDALTVAYMPVEGWPVDDAIANAFQRVDVPITYTHASAAALRPAGIPNAHVIPHGVDLAEFHPLESWKRKKLRESFGWADKWVISYVARNNGRKAHDRLLRAAAILIHGGMSDLRLYLHCSPFEHGWNGGFDLRKLARWLNIEEYVEFPGFTDGKKGTPAGTLVERLACSDFYAHVSKIEGFGLPILEAMACGVPVGVTNDNGNMAEVAGAGAAAHFEPYDIEIHSSGAELFVVSPEKVADTIARARAQPFLMTQARERGFRHVNDPRFRWLNIVGDMADLIEREYAERSAVE